MGLGCFVSTGRSLPAALERVRLAEDLGYGSCWVTHVNGRESLTVLTAYAGMTDRIRLGTGVVPIYTRTPATMAQTAATIDDLSGGRLNLGLGVSHRPVVEGWHGQTIDKPVAEMREYVATVRAILRGEPPPEGERWRTGFALAGLGPFPDLPVYVAGLSPGMLRLAGEVADGVVLWLCNPRYIADVVVPAIREGRARAAMRRDLVPYLGLPFYRAMLERSGFGADLEAYDAAAARGDGEGLQAAASDALLGALTAVGDADTVRAGVRRYLDAGTTSPCLGPIPRTDFEATLLAGAG
jgi:alkanesulfonate monooxygenase SsuD/methylene tetrahydromethanopterin reductase-like flavin-dependent oxidoreductase (luciferase family)